MIQLLIKENAMKIIVKHMSSEDISFRLNACWILSNILSCNNPILINKVVQFQGL